MKEGVEGRNGGRFAHGGVQHVLPQALPLEGKTADLFHPVHVEFFAEDLFEKLYVLVELRAHIGACLFGKFSMAEGRIEYKHGHVEVAGLHLVPHQHLPQMK